MKVKLSIKTAESDNKIMISEILALKKIHKSSTSYKYIDEFGRTELEIFSNSVSIKRFGKINSSLTLRRNLNTSFQYKTNYFDSEFNISTKNLLISNNGFKCSYSIFQEKMLINNIFISIHEA